MLFSIDKYLSLFGFPDLTATVLYNGKKCSEIVSEKNFLQKKILPPGKVEKRFEECYIDFCTVKQGGIP